MHVSDWVELKDSDTENDKAQLRLTHFLARNYVVLSTCVCIENSFDALI